ncbi:MAG TPA: hypothetical protein PK854_08750 [Oscillospiraceae bacterium]|nr:hypothetical protein [Oscillospiraceae bacterium]HPS35341.1 hypothetical protein [Oscillospiraceae bacterium]
MKRTVFKKAITILAMLFLLCTGCQPVQSRGVVVTFPLEVYDKAPKQMRNYFGTHYYLTAEHVLYGWGRNFGYALELPLPEQYVSDQPVKLAENVMDVEGCGYATFILKSDKSLWVIGNYPNSETGGNFCERFMKIADGVSEIMNYIPGQYCCYILKDNGDLYIIGTTQGSGMYQNLEMRLVDSSVTSLNGYFYEAQGNGKITDMVSSSIFKYYFSYYKQNTIWYLSEDENGNFTVEKKHENVQSSTQYAYGYIDEANNFCLDGFYVTEDGTELKPTNGVKIMAKNVAQLYGGEGFIFGYLTLKGDLYINGKNYIDVDTGNTVESGTVKVAEGVKFLYQFDLSFHQSTLYFLKDDGSLWAIGENSMITGDGSIPTEVYRDNRSVYSEMDLTVTDELKEPVKILDNVVEFTSSYYSKIAVTADGKRYIWGMDVIAAIPNSAGYSPEGVTSDEYIISKRASSLEESNQMKEELAAYQRADVYLVPTLWEDVFGQLFPGDE